MQNFHCAICYLPNVNTSETPWGKTICYLPPPGDQIFNLCWSWENWEVKCFIFILSPPLLKLNFLFPWFLRGFNYEDDQLTVLDPWLNSQPSIKSMNSTMRNKNIQKINRLSSTFCSWMVEEHLVRLSWLLKMVMLRWWILSRIRSLCPQSIRSCCFWS